MRREGYGKCSRSTFSSGSGGSGGMTALLDCAAASLSVASVRHPYQYPIVSIRTGERHRMSWVPGSTVWRAGSTTDGRVRTTTYGHDAYPQSLYEMSGSGLL